MFLLFEFENGWTRHGFKVFIFLKNQNILDDSEWEKKCISNLILYLFLF